jgi:large subunit ribosomal protein L15
MIRLHNLKPRPGSKHRVKRLGCGESSGHGKTSGKGHKGQKARSGGSHRLGFEGGQMPLIRRLPKRGFNNAAFKVSYSLINLDDLNAFKAGSTVNEKALRAANLVRGRNAGVKILGRGELAHGLTIEADRVSESARAKIEKAGGTITLRDRSTRPDEVGSRKDFQAAEQTSAPEPKAKVAAKKTPAPRKKKGSSSS